jgi:hypothetical protein
MLTLLTVRQAWSWNGNQWANGEGLGNLLYPLGDYSIETDSAVNSNFRGDDNSD